MSCGNSDDLKSVYFQLILLCVVVVVVVELKFYLPGPTVQQQVLRRCSQSG